MTKETTERLALPLKRIICLRKEADQGKTRIIIALAKLLMPDPLKALTQANAQWFMPLSTDKIKAWGNEIWQKIINRRDICIALDVQEKRVGLCSYGDPGKVIKDCLKFLLDQNCSIIICACRTRGETVKVVEDKANEGGHTVIWTTPYVNYEPLEKGLTPLQNKLNQQKAEHLKDFI